MLAGYGAERPEECCCSLTEREGDTHTCTIKTGKYTKSNIVWLAG